MHFLKKFINNIALNSPIAVQRCHYRVFDTKIFLIHENMKLITFIHTLYTVGDPKGLTALTNLKNMQSNSTYFLSFVVTDKTIYSNSKYLFCR